MKIAFIGTHGVGKTTLCFELAARLKRYDMSVDIVKEVARRCPMPINQDTTLDAQAWIFHSQIAEEIASAHSYEVQVCDRSVLDNYAYLVHATGRRPELDAMVAHWVKSYDALFKVPITREPSFDGTRDVSESFQRDIDILLDELLENFSVDCQELGSLPREKWIPAVIRSIGLPDEPPQYDLFGSEASKS